MRVYYCLKGEQPPHASVYGLDSVASLEGQSTECVLECVLQPLKVCQAQTSACRLGKHQSKCGAALWTHQRPQGRSKAASTSPPRKSQNRRSLKMDAPRMQERSRSWTIEAARAAGRLRQERSRSCDPEHARPFALQPALSAVFGTRNSENFRTREFEKNKIAPLVMFASRRTEIRPEN